MGIRLSIHIAGLDGPLNHKMRYFLQWLGLLATHRHVTSEIPPESLK